MVAISFAHDLRGTWRGEFGDLTYPIVQEVNRVGWYAERNHERATRTINGLHVSVSWAEDWGSGSDTGRSSLTPPSASSGLTGTTGMSSPDSTDRRRPGVCLRHVRWIVAAPWKHRRNRDPWTSGERRPDPRIDPRSCQFGQRAAIGIMRRLVGLGGGALSLGVEAAGPRAVSWRKQEGVNG